MDSHSPARVPELPANEQSFRQLAESIGAVFRLTDASDGSTICISPRYETIWGRPCENLYQSSRSWFDAIHPQDHDRMLETSLSVQKTGGYDEEYRIVQPEGDIRWIRERAFPIRNDAGEICRVASISEEITETKFLEKEVIELNDRERSRLGQDLHDGICQQLVSIAFATDLLRRDLLGKLPGEAVRAEKITALLDSAISQARNLSNALCPVNLAGDGLAVALRSMAATATQGSGVICGVDCAETVFIQDYALATHLYRIAQEAVQNAIQFSRATQVLVRLSQNGSTIQLAISDNGKELENTEPRDRSLSIIKFRIRTAGGRLQIQKTPTGGTAIQCTFQQKTLPDVAAEDASLQLLEAKG